MVLFHTTTLLYLCDGNISCKYKLYSVSFVLGRLNGRLGQRLMKYGGFKLGYHEERLVASGGWSAELAEEH